MKKALCLAVILAILISITVFATGCNKKKDTEGKTVITFWHFYPEGDEHAPLIRSILDDFEKKHPDIVVDDLGISFWDYGPKLTTAMAAGEAPDITIGGTDVGIRARSGAVLNLQEYMDKENFDTSIFAPASEYLKYDGDFYGMPWQFDLRVLFYNKKMFREAGLDPDKPPRTLEELEQYSDKLTKKDADGNLEVVGFNPRIGNFWPWTAIWAQGGDITDENNYPQIDTPKNLEVLEWWGRMYTKYGVEATQALESQATAMGFSAFIAEKAAMVVEVNNLYNQILLHNPDLEFGVAPIPYADGCRATWASIGSLEIVDNKDKEKADAAWECVKYLAGYDASKKYIQGTHFLIANMDAMNDPEVITDEIYKGFVEEVQYGKVFPFIEGCEALNAYVNDAFVEIETGVKEPKQALEDAQKKAEEAIEIFKDSQK